MAEKKSILLRLSPKMWEEISKWAEDEFRSVNGQIEYLISDALRKRNKSAQKQETDESYKTTEDNESNNSTEGTESNQSTEDNDSSKSAVSSENTKAESSEE